jgi:hypothetical protein
VHLLRICERLPRLRATSPRCRLSSRIFVRRSYLTTCRTQSWDPPHLTNKPSVLFRSGSAPHGMPTQTRAAAAFRRGFLAPRSHASLHARSRQAPSSRQHDDGTSSSSDEGGPRVYTAPRPASTLPPGKTPLIGRAGRAIFGCGISLAGASLFLCRILPPCRRTGLTKR